jgi:hypothetical protein
MTLLQNCKRERSGILGLYVRKALESLTELLYTRLTDESQARQQSLSKFVSNRATDKYSTFHPSRKANLISSWLTLLGPHEPGSSSLKQSM